MARTLMDPEKFERRLPRLKKLYLKRRAEDERYFGYLRELRKLADIAKQLEERKG